jgi:hypothetical protein
VGTPHRLRQGKDWNIVIQFYSPLQPWFTKTCKPGDIEEVHAN